MKTARRTLCITAVVALLAGACGGDDDSVTANGTLTVCAVADGAPFTAQEGSAWTGLEVDLLQGVAEQLELDFAVVADDLDGLWRRPASGTCDIAAGGIVASPERAAEAAFSTGHLDGSLSLLVRSGEAADLPDIAAISGSTLGVGDGRYGAQYAQANAPIGATVRAFASSGQLYEALASGDIDAILQGDATNAARLAENGDFARTSVIDTGLSIAFATAPEASELLAAVQTALDDLAADGTIDDLIGSYLN